VIPKYRRRILEALEHCRCPECGKPASFVELEVSVTTWTYNPKKGRWDYSGCESVEEHAIDPHDVHEEVYQVQCQSCQKPLTWPNRRVVDALDSNHGGFSEWLEALADEWEAQKEERVTLAAELEAAKENINPVGHLAELEARLKALDTITGLKPLEAKVDAIKSANKAELEALKKEEFNE
jgi:hypothetical protein